MAKDYEGGQSIADIMSGYLPGSGTVLVYTIKYILGEEIVGGIIQFVM